MSTGTAKKSFDKSRLRNYLKNVLRLAEGQWFRDKKLDGATEELFIVKYDSQIWLQWEGTTLLEKYNSPRVKVKVNIPKMDSWQHSFKVEDETGSYLMDLPCWHDEHHADVQVMLQVEANNGVGFEEVGYNKHAIINMSIRKCDG